ncbi:MAG: AAA family ATPase [Cyanobacteria bacterium P01_G01_bin.39]
MKTNPGGIVAPQDVVGRDKLIAKIWMILEQQSLILSAERRMGKTTIIKKMEAEAGDSRIPIYRDLEGVRSPIEFVEAIWQDVEEYLGNRGKAKRVRDFLSNLEGIEFSGFKFSKIAAPHWKTLLTKTIEDLVTNQERQVIFLWDEMPYMLNNVGDQLAMEILDTLRSLRQTYPDLRMVFTGSIGLHHVVKKLQQQGYSNEPTNDMYPIDVPPLSLLEAIRLTTSLIAGEKIKTDNKEIIAKEIAQSVDCIPFYIHHLVRKLKFIDESIDLDSVREAVNNSLLDNQNSWKMDHYRDRIDNYYELQQRKYALSILDILAVETALSFNDLWQRLALDNATSDKEIARDILRLLLKDYYLVQQDKTYSFRYELVGKYWSLSRGL